MLGMISTRLFWKGYHLWKKRKVLVSHLWKHILPVEWNKSSRTKARKRVMQDSLCKDPFHYFQKLFAYSTQKIKVSMLQSIAHKAVENRRHSFFSDQGSTYN